MKSSLDRHVRLGSHLDEDSYASNGDRQKVSGSQSSFMSPRTKKLKEQSSIKSTDKSSLVSQPSAPEKSKDILRDNSVKKKRILRTPSKNVSEIQPDITSPMYSIFKGHFDDNDRIVSYSIRQLEDKNFVINLNVPITGQNYSVIVFSTEEVLELFRIWNRNSVEGNIEGMEKLRSFFLNNLTIEFDGFTIVRANFSNQEFERSCIRDLALIISSAAILIQANVRGLLMRKTYQLLLKAYRRTILSSRQGRLKANQIKEKNANSLSNRRNGKNVGIKSPQKQVETDLIEFDKSKKIAKDNFNEAVRLYSQSMNALGTRQRNKDVINNITSPTTSNSNNNKDNKESGYSEYPRKVNVESTAEDDMDDPEYLKEKIKSMKVEIADALDAFQKELEGLRDFVYLKKSDNDEGDSFVDSQSVHSVGQLNGSEINPESSDIDLRTPYLEAKKPLISTITKSYLSTGPKLDSIVRIRDANVLRNELATLATKLQNVEMLYQLQRQNNIEIEEKARIEIAKARLAAEITSDRAASRVRNETVKDYENRLFKLKESENLKRILEVEEVRRQEEVLLMANEDFAKRVFDQGELLEGKIKQLKVEIFLRDIMLEKIKAGKEDPRKEEKPKVNDYYEYNNFERPSRGIVDHLRGWLNRARARKQPSASGKEETSPSKKIPKHAQSEKIAGKSSSSWSSSGDSFSVMARVISIWKKKPPPPPVLSHEAAQYRVRKFIRKYIERFKSGQLKSTRFDRLRNLLLIIEKTEDPIVVSNAMKTSIECNNIDLAKLSLTRLHELLTACGNKAQPLKINSKYFGEMLKHFFMKSYITSMVLEAMIDYVQLNHSYDPSSEIFRSFHQTKVLADIYEVMIHYIDDEAMIFRFTKFILRYCSEDEPSRRSMMREDYIVTLIDLFAVFVKNPGIVENISRVFVRVCENSQPTMKLICRERFCEAIYACFEESLVNERLISSLLKLITALCSNSLTRNQEMLSSSYYPVVFSKAISFYKSSPKMFEEVVRCLYSLLLCYVFGKRRFQDAGVLKKFVRLLDDAKFLPGVVLNSIWAVSFMSSPGRHSQVVVNDEIIRRIIALRDFSKNKEVSRRATIALSELLDPNRHGDDIDTPPDTPNRKSREAQAPTFLPFQTYHDEDDLVDQLAESSLQSMGPSNPFNFASVYHDDPSLFFPISGSINPYDVPKNVVLPTSNNIVLNQVELPGETQGPSYSLPSQNFQESYSYSHQNNDPA